MTKLEQFEANFADAKARYLEIMKGENDAAILFKWIADNGINEHGVFHDRYYANGSSTLEGWVGLYLSLHHAMYDDGDVTFVKTKGQGPKLEFNSKHESNFEKQFMIDVPEMLKESYTIVGYMDTVQEYIAEYERHDAERIAFWEKIKSHGAKNDYVLL